MYTESANIQELYRKYRVSAFAVIALTASALVLTFKDKHIAFAALACAVLCHIFISRRLQKQYVSAFNRKNIQDTVCRLTACGNVSEKGGFYINATTIEASHLMPCGYSGSSPLLCWELKGTLKDFPVALCDATIPQLFHLKKNGKNRVHFNSGAWTHIELPKDTGLDIKLLDETSVPTPVRMEYFASHTAYSTAPLNDSELAKRMVLYKPSADDAVIPDSLIKKVKRLVEYTPGYVAVSISGSVLDVFIRGRFLAVPVSVSKGPDPDKLKMDPFPELSYIIDIAISVCR